MESTSATDDPDMGFVNLVLMVGAAAQAALGEIPNPLTGKGSLNPARARTHINVLLSLQKKTRGRLSLGEDRLLGEMIQDLQSKYTETLKGPGRGADPKPQQPGEKGLELMKRLIEEKRRMDP